MTNLVKFQLYMNYAWIKGDDKNAHSDIHTNAQVHKRTNTQI